MKKDYFSPTVAFRELRLKEKVADVCWAWAQNNQYPDKEGILYWNEDGLSVPGYWQLTVIAGGNGVGCDGATVTMTKFLGSPGTPTGETWTGNGLQLWVRMGSHGNSAEPFNGLKDYTYNTPDSRAN